MAAETHPDNERFHKYRNRRNALSYAIAKCPRIEGTKQMAYVFIVDLFWYNQTGDTLLADGYLRLRSVPIPVPVPVPVPVSGAGGNAGCGMNIPESHDNAGAQQEHPLFSPDAMRLFDAVIETLKEEQTESVCRVIHQLSLLNKRGVGTVITAGDFRLDEYEYEYDMIESFFWYHRAVQAARKIEEDTDMVNDMSGGDSDSDTVPEAMLYLQFQAMEREDDSVH